MPLSKSTEIKANTHVIFKGEKFYAKRFFFSELVVVEKNQNQSKHPVVRN